MSGRLMAVHSIVVILSISHSPASATLSGPNIVSGLRDVEVRDPGPGRFLVRTP